jgi:hypothetical protein
VPKAKRAGILIATALGGAIGGYLAALLILVAVGIAWNVLAYLAQAQGEDFSSARWVGVATVPLAAGTILGAIYAVRLQVKGDDDTVLDVAAFLVGLVALGFLAVFGFVYGMARAGEALFGSFGWGLVAAFVLFLGGALIAGIIHGFRANGS